LGGVWEGKRGVTHPWEEYGRPERILRNALAGAWHACQAGCRYQSVGAWDEALVAVSKQDTGVVGGAAQNLKAMKEGKWRFALGRLASVKVSGFSTGPLVDHERSA
jgi:hypothetical protein